MMMQLVVSNPLPTSTTNNNSKKKEERKKGIMYEDIRSGSRWHDVTQLHRFGYSDSYADILPARLPSTIAGVE